MNLKRCTLTGVGRENTLMDLLALSATYPFAEWGVLYSTKRAGEGRYPDADWIRELTEFARATHAEVPMNLALHICGSAVGDYLKGVGEASELARDFGRVQLNFEAGRWDSRDVAEAMLRNGHQKVITQHNEKNADLWTEVGLIPNHQVLFDASGGNGKSPDAWPEPLSMHICGYAGGLGPDNIDEQLDEVLQAAGGRDFWIDMESSLRDENDKFSLGRAALVLGSCNLRMKMTPLEGLTA